PQGIQREVRLDMTSGEHRLRVEYVHRDKAHGCEFYWQPTGYPMQPFPELTPFKSAALTDSKGVFRFGDLPPGRYQVRIHVPGGHIYAQDGRSIEVKSGEPVTGIEFRIAPFKKGTWSRWTQRDGLPSDEVSAIREAADGALWVATFSGGISRWDGR